MKNIGFNLDINMPFKYKISESPIFFIVRNQDLRNLYRKLYEELRKRINEVNLHV